MTPNTRFFSRILLPSLGALLLFLIAIYLFVIPNYRESLLEKKRETIRELVNSSWSVMQKLSLLVGDEFSIEKAQNEAVAIISEMRWGPELKDYFWITDTLPRMVMHPYLPSLNDTDLSEYKDLGGKKLFVEMVNTVKLHGNGYVEYAWQWKDDSTKVVPKLSFVKKFAPWGWIVGTGIYVDDVKAEINRIIGSLFWLSILITLLIASIIAYLAQRNYVAENERQIASEKLQDSMERYKKLVEASTDGVLLMIGDEFSYCNPYLINLLEFSQHEFDNKDELLIATLKSFAKTDYQAQNEPFGEKKHDLTTEQIIKKKSGANVVVVVSRSDFEIEGKHGFIFSVKDVSKHKDVERELDLSMEKFKSLADLMNLGIFRCTLGRRSRLIEMNTKALNLLGYNTLNDLSETSVQELLIVKGEKREVVHAINQGIHIKDKLLRIKRADGEIIEALVSLFPVKDTHGNTIFCDGIIIDAYNRKGDNGRLSREESKLDLTDILLLRPIKDFLIPAPTCPMDTPVRIAAKLLVSTGSNIVLVVNENLLVIGILTQGDISRRLVAANWDDTISVSQIMSAPVISVSHDDLVMDAFRLMVQYGISNIVVASNDEKKYFYVSLLKLSEVRKDSPEHLIYSIQKSDSNFEISETLNRLPHIIAQLADIGAGVSAIGKLISKISDTITEKFINDTIKELGPPPASFVFIVLGSEGRKEQTLATDQDNAIIFDSVGNEKDLEHGEYFLKLGNRVCGQLSRVGYPLCKGEVMAKNKQWCMSIYDWEKTIAEWIRIPNPQEILKVSIFFDFRPVFGNFELTDRLQKFCLKGLKNQSIFFHNLAQSTINLQVNNPDSIRDGEEYDIKMPILAITTIARLWVLKYGIIERNTSDRLLALKKIGVFTDSLYNEVEQAYKFLTLMRLKIQLNQIKSLKQPNNKIDVKSFSSIEKVMIKRIVSEINEHYAKIGADFR